MSEEKQPEQNKSTRSFEEWKMSLNKLVARTGSQPTTPINDERIRIYYDQGLQPYVAFNELFNK